MDIQSIKETVKLTDLAEILELTIKEGQGTCPFCQSSKAFNVRNNRTFKCYRCNLTGSVIDFAIAAGAAQDVSSAIKFVGQYGQLTERSLQRQIYCNDLEQVYNQLMVKHPAIDECLAKRGWSKGKHTDGIRYWPPGTYMQDRGWSVAKLEELNLYSYGQEYYGGYLIFPVRNIVGRMVHLSGRAVDPNKEPRWKHTKGTPNCTNYLYNEQMLQDKSLKYLVICEGITDCISMQELGEPAVGMFGINAPLVQHVSAMRNLDYIVAVFDRDTYALGTPEAGRYKSWSQVTPTLIELSSATEVPVLCLLVPNWSGVKDVNEYLVEIDYDVDTYLEYARKNHKPLNEFAFELYHSDLKVHNTLWQLQSKVPHKPTTLKLDAFVKKNYPSYPDYLVAINA